MLFGFCFFRVFPVFHSLTPHGWRASFLFSLFFIMFGFLSFCRTVDLSFLLASLLLHQAPARAPYRAHRKPHVHGKRETETKGNDSRCKQVTMGTISGASWKTVPEIAPLRPYWRQTSFKASCADGKGPRHSEPKLFCAALRVYFVPVWECDFFLVKDKEHAFPRNLILQFFEHAFRRKLCLQPHGLRPSSSFLSCLCAFVLACFLACLLSSCLARSLACVLACIFSGLADQRFGAGALASSGSRVLGASFTSIEGTFRLLFGLGGSRLSEGPATSSGTRFVFVLETIRTRTMRVNHITVKTEETQILRIKFVLVLSYLNQTHLSTVCTVLSYLC